MLDIPAGTEFFIDKSAKIEEGDMVYHPGTKTVFSTAYPELSKECGEIFVDYSLHPNFN